MAMESISNLVSAAQDPVESAMTSKITSNSKDAASQGQGFAAVLFTSLGHAISDIEAESERAISSNSILNSQGDLKHGSDGSSTASQRRDISHGAGTEMAPPSRKSDKRPDIVPARIDTAVLPSTARDTNAATNLTQQQQLDHSRNWNVTPHSGNIPAFEPDSYLAPNDEAQTFNGIAEANHSPLLNVVPTNDSAASINVPSSPISSITSNSGQLPRSWKDDSVAISAKPQSHPTSLEVGPANQPDVTAATTGNNQIQESPVVPLRQTTNPALEIPSPIPGMRHAVSDRSDPLQSNQPKATKASNGSAQMQAMPVNPLVRATIATPQLASPITAMQPAVAERSNPARQNQPDAATLPAGSAQAGASPIDPLLRATMVAQQHASPITATQPAIAEQSDPTQQNQRDATTVTTGNAQTQASLLDSPLRAMIVTTELEPLITEMQPAVAERSDPVQQNRPDATAVPTDNTQTRDLPVDPLLSATTPDPPPPSIITEVQPATPNATDPMQSQLPTANVVTVVGRFFQTNVVLKEDSHGNVPTVDSAAAKALKNPTVDGHDQAQSQSAPPNVAPVAARFVEPTSILKDAPTGILSGTPNGFSTGATAHKSSSFEINVVPPAPPTLETSSGNQNSSEPQPLQMAETESLPSIPTIVVESLAAAESTESPSFTAELSSGAQEASRAPLLDAAAMEVPDLKSDDASTSAGDDSQKDAGKNSTNHAFTSAATRPAESDTISSSGTVSAEPPKLELSATVQPTPGTTTDAPSTLTGKPVLSDGATLIHVAEPLGKSGHPSEAAGSPNANDSQHTTVTPSARLTSQISNSDVKIALQGEQIGSVELRAKVTGDQVSASITVERHDTHALLSGDLSALNQGLNERQLRVSEIILLHDSLLSGGSRDGDSPAKREEGSGPQTGSQSANSGEESSLAAAASDGRAGAIPIFNSKGRLSVRA
jgi:hypothetical protein